MFDKLLALEATPDGQAGSGNWVVLIVIYALFFVAIYLLMFRPQKKQQKALKELLSQLEIGDVVLTSSGFYGTIIDIADDTVIVEFGNNKNCRIPMQKTAIVDCEKQDSGNQTESK